MRILGLALHEVSQDQRLILFVTWFSWTLGAMDTMIYSLVLTPALTDLLSSAESGGPASTAAVGWYGGVILSTFLLGWAVGGVGLGSLADSLGRRPVMIFCMVLVALSTSLTSLAQHWWHLAGTRFFTGVGIGGLWAAGAALVAEVWPEGRCAPFAREASRLAQFLRRRLAFDRSGLVAEPLHARLDEMAVLA
jgi:MFS family permease